MSTLHDRKGIKAILLMAGDGMRFGSDLPKQFHRISGKKVYLHTLEKFLASQLFEEIILVCHANWLDVVKEDLNAYKTAPLKLIPGGASRQASSHLGLLACGPDTKYVVIHDAVRPFVTTEILENNIKGAAVFGAVDTCIPSTDTLVHVSKDNKISNIPKRSEYLRGQTPQSFSFPLIMEAHARAQKLNLADVSDDCRLIVDMGKDVYVVPGDEHNIKITTELDLFLAEQLFRLPQKLSSNTAFSIKGKRYAVTGGSGGIGTAICNALLQEGAYPINISRSSKDFSADLTSYEAAKEAFSQLHTEHGPIDGLINSLGLFKVKEIQELSEKEIQEIIAVNLTGLIYSCKCAKIKQGGHIINIASSAYFRGRKDYAIYSSSKAAVVNFTQGLAEELPFLKINALVPQRTKTAMRLQNFPEENQETLLSPDTVAKAIVDLLKQDTTGAIVEVRK